MTVRELIDKLQACPDQDAEVWFDESHTYCPIVALQIGVVVDDGEFLYAREDFDDMTPEEADDVRKRSKHAVILLDWDGDLDSED
jgi:hypothetical protein